MMGAAEQHYFVCANTAKGFVDYFSSNLADLDRVFILKGGSGTGKSTIMSRIGKAYQECDYAVEYIHCSSDANSLDGVIIPDLSVAVVDGTSPHVIEPVLPGAIEDYVNLGIALERKKLEPHKEEMLALKKEISGHYVKVYDYLQQAAVIKEKAHVTVQEILPLEANKQQDIMEQILGKMVLMKKAVLKHRFCGDLTAKGDVYPGLDIAKSAEMRYFISGKHADEVFSLLTEAATERGYDVMLYHDHLQPEKIIFMAIPEKSLCILNYHYHAVKKLRQPNDQWFDFDALESTTAESSQLPNASVEDDESERLIAKACEALQAARKAHGALEQFYYPAVDFEVVEQIYDAIRSEIAAIG